MRQDMPFKPVEFSSVTLLLKPFEGLVSLLLMPFEGLITLLISFEGLISRLPGFLDQLNFDFSIDETFVFLDILVYDVKNVFVFRPQAVE